MAANIKSILKKKKWTGKELGMLEIANLCHDFTYILKGQKPPAPIVPPEELQNRAKALETMEQKKIYNGYISIHNWIENTFRMAQMMEQQALYRYTEILNYLTSAKMTEELYEYISKLPAIVTQKQYEDIVAAGREAMLHGEGEEKGEYADNIPSLIERAIDHFFQLYQKDKSAKNPLKKIFEKYKTEPVSSKHILGKYNEAFGLGYYELEDGRRSDQMTPREWGEAIMPSEKFKALFGWLTEHLCEKNPLHTTKHLLDPQEIYSMARCPREEGWGGDYPYYPTMNRKDFDGEEVLPATWHYYDEPPAKTNKLELLEVGLYEFYEDLFCGEGTDKEYMALCKDFMAEFLEAIAAAHKEIDKLLTIDGKTLKEFPLKQWRDVSLDWEELYKLDYYGMREFCDGDTQAFEGNPRALINGIAILRPSDLLNKSPRIDDRGYYVEPQPAKLLNSLLSLEAFFPDNDNYASNVKNLEDYYYLVERCYYFIKGYRKALELIGRAYDVPDIILFAMDDERLKGKMEAFNNILASLVTDIKNGNYSKTEEENREKKLTVLNDVFRPIEVESLAIPEDRIEKVQRDILTPDMEYFSSPEGKREITNLLCWRD